MRSVTPSVFAVDFLALLLALTVLGTFAIVVVASILIASRHSLPVWQKIKAALAVLVWVVPAVAVVVVFVGFVGVRWSPRQAATISSTLNGSEMRVAVNSHSADTHFSTESTVSRTNPFAAAVWQEPQAASASSIGGLEGAAGLKVRKMSSEEPKWGTADNIVNGRELIPLDSQRFATLAEAESQITELALARVREQYQRDYPLLWERGTSAELVGLVDRYAVKDFVGEVLDKDFGNGIKGKMYRAHLRLDFSPEFRDGLQQTWRGKAVSQRLVALGSVLGLATLMLGTAAVYFRLDDATQGAYRRRLKLAAVAMISAGSLAAFQVLRL